MRNIAVAFVTTRQNKNSVAVLAGLLESDSRAQDLPLLFWPMEEFPAQFVSARSRFARLFVLWSFCTPQRDAVERQLQKVQCCEADSSADVCWIAGGPHPSGAPRDTLSMGFDIVVVGEAERTLAPLLATLLGGGAFQQLPGLAFYRDGCYCFTGRAPRAENLDKYPPFARDHRLFAPIEITRGCPFACRFCQTSYLFGGRPRHRSPEQVVYWSQIAKDMGIPFMRFVTPNALSYGSLSGREQNLAWLERLLVGVGRIMGSDRVYIGSFPSEVRPEMVTDEAISLIAKLTGNRNITLGAQSGSGRVLAQMNRGHTVEDVYRACEVILRYGLVPNVDFIFGFPGEMEADREASRRMIVRLVEMGARVRSHAFLPLAGTPLAEAQPGRIDERTDRLLGALARIGRQHGARRHVPRLVKRKGS